YVSDVLKIEQQTLLLTQLLDLGFPVVWVLNRSDLETPASQQVDPQVLSAQFGVPVVKVSTKTSEGLAELKRYFDQSSSTVPSTPSSFYPLQSKEAEMIAAARSHVETRSDYQTLLQLHHGDWLQHLGSQKQETLRQIRTSVDFQSIPAQVDETMARYDAFLPLLQKAIKKAPTETDNHSDRLDRILLHWFWGPFIFLLLMLLVFQAIYAWATYPMDLIEGSFNWLSSQLGQQLPESWMTSLLVDGILPGIGGVVIFVPQIAILFFLIGCLEEGGYMARAASSWDLPMQALGLNGRSMVALISGGACAVPAIMSTRSIANQKERLLTILATPFISCSARIPVYTILIGFVVPEQTVLGIFNLQGLAFMGLFLAGIAGAALIALGFKQIIKSEEQSTLALELPTYQWPALRNVGLETWNKVKAFIQEAGKVILMISIVLWFAASYGPGDSLAQAKEIAIAEAQAANLAPDQEERLIASKQLETSYAGRFGKAIEPIIAPLGFDWKIGIALLTSFAAREVFVGTMATIYNVEDTEDNQLSIQQRMAREVHPLTGQPVYTLGASLALLVFYIFALQCMSTLAIIRKETGGWKWAIALFFIALLVAYAGAWMVYRFFSP
ncbi:MAG: ferrous iron transport protein B, partial [Bacteroidota bacterium]